MRYDDALAALRPFIKGTEIAETVATYRAYPLRLSFSSYAKGIDWVAAQYRETGLEAEVVPFPADGKATFGDRHFPLAWDVEEGWLEALGGSLANGRLADYGDDPYGIVPFSADSGGVQEAVLVPEEALRNGTRPAGPFAVLFMRFPKFAETSWAVAQGSVAVVATHEAAPDDAIAYDARKWFNSAFGDGQIDSRHATLPGFSVTPRQADALLRNYAANGPVPIRFLMKAKAYEGQAPLATARIVGAEEPEKEVWLSAHAYEPNSTNNCSGVAMCLAAARAIVQAVESGALPPPKRTIRFLHGLETWGVYAYAMRHPDKMKDVLCGMSIDGVGCVDRNGVLERFCHVRNSSLHPSFAHALTHYAIADCAQRLGVEKIHMEGSPTNDDVINDPMFGPAWGLLYGMMYETAGYYHTNADTLDKLCPDRLGHCAAMEAAWAWHVAAAGTDEARETARAAAASATSWLAEACSRAASVRQPSPQAAQQRLARLKAFVKLATDAGMEAVLSAGALADPADRKALEAELQGVAFQFRQASRDLAKHAAESVRQAAGPPGGDMPKRAPTPVEDEARTLVARRLFPGHLGLGTLGDELREKAAELFGRRSLEYWSFDKIGQQLRYLWLDGKRTVYEAARCAWAVGGKWDAPEEEGEWEENLRAFVGTVSLLEEAGVVEASRKPAVSKADVAAAAKQVGVQRGDVVLLHSSLSQIGHVEGGPDAVADGFMEVVGREGVLVLPAFTHTADGQTDPPFDPERSVAWTGAIPNAFWRREGVLRSAHPTHSLAAWGDKAEEFLDSPDPLDTFDRNGPWGKLLDWGGKILFIGETMGANTFMHALEAWLLNYLEPAYAHVLEGGRDKQVRIANYPAGCRGTWYGLARKAEYFRRLQAAGVYRETQLGAAALLAADAPAVARELHKIFQDAPDFFLHKSGCMECARRRAMLEGWQVPEEV